MGVGGAGEKESFVLGAMAHAAQIRPVAGGVQSPRDRVKVEAAGPTRAMLCTAPLCWTTYRARC